MATAPSLSSMYTSGFFTYEYTRISPKPFGAAFNFTLNVKPNVRSKSILTSQIASSVLCEVYEFVDFLVPVKRKICKKLIGAGSLRLQDFFAIRRF